MKLKRLFTRKWIAATVLAILAVGIMVRLGIWQLDRLEQRRSFNARVIEQIEQEPLELTGDNLKLDLTGMEYRKVVLRGRYDFSQEVALRNQVWNDKIGVHLLTPLRISGTDQVVIVDRGWIPQDVYLTGDWSSFAEPGEVNVEGVIRATQSKPDFGRIADPTPMPRERIESWNLANINQMAKQMSYPLLPVYIQQTPDGNWLNLPYRNVAIPELSEGSHMSYAIQWFAFASILAIGYPLYIGKNDSQRALKRKRYVLRKVEK